MHYSKTILKKGDNFFTWNGSVATKEQYDEYQAALAEETEEAPPKKPRGRKPAAK